MKFPNKFTAALHAARDRLVSGTMANGAAEVPASGIKFRQAVICELCGGLANQIICYKVGRYIADTQQRTLVLDTSWYATHRDLGNRNLQVTRFAIRYDAFSESKRWVEAVVRRHRSVSIAGPAFQNFESSDTHHKAVELLNTPAEIIYCDLWAGLTLRKIADSHASEAYRKEFWAYNHGVTANEQNQRVQALIEACPSPVAVHVRRGDFAIHDGNLLLKADYYNNAIKSLTRNLELPSFFIFSDEIDWCKKHLEQTDNLHFVDINSEREAYFDLSLAIRCKHFVLSHRSTLSHQMAELSNPTIGQLIVRSSDDDFERNFRVPSGKNK